MFQIVHLLKEIEVQDWGIIMKSEAYFAEKDVVKRTKLLKEIWHVECHIEGMKDYFSADGSSKKSTKKEAAFKMLSYILDLDEEAQCFQ